MIKKHKFSKFLNLNRYPEVSKRQIEIKMKEIASKEGVSLTKFYKVNM